MNEMILFFLIASMLLEIQRSWISKRFNKQELTSVKLQNLYFFPFKSLIMLVGTWSSLKKNL